MGENVKKYPLVTVLMPVFNAERYVKEAVNSILNQSLKDFELLIIDDGSTDSSYNILKSYNDSRIRLYKNEKNLGLIVTLNKGFELSEGKYIARMDADDIALPARLEKQFTFMENNPATGVLGSAFQEFKANGKGKIIRFLNNNDELKCVLLFNSCMGHPTIMFRTEFIKKKQLKYDSAYIHAEDYELWSRAIQLTRFSNHPFPLLLYRLHDSQISKSQSDGQKMSTDKIRLRMLGCLNLTPDGDELKIHNAIGNKQTLNGLNEIMAAERWFNKIIEANKEVKYINEPVLNRYLSVVFQDVCANSSAGIKAFYYFNNSPIKIHSPKSIIFKLKFFIKCLVR